MSDEPKPPTCDQLCDEDGCKVVSRSSDPSWRHGSRETTVFHRESDGTFWEAHYRVSTDGETHELREGEATIRRVYPHEVTVTVYKPTPAKETPDAR
jgi:hypothetical protein